MGDEHGGEKAEFNQAFFQQKRMDDMLGLVDRLSIDIFMFNYETNSYHYELIFASLTSVLSTISAKLTPKESIDIKEQRKKIRKFLLNNPIFKTNIDARNKKTMTIYTKNKDELSDLLFNYRWEIERLMDVHEFGNPSKKDPTRAIAQN